MGNDHLPFILRCGYCKWLLMLCVQFVVPSIKAQQPYSLIHYDESDLPQTSIGNIQQDATGYLWMSSQYGIVRFDGETFRVFTTANLKGLTSNRIGLCAKSPDNKICFVDENHTIITVKSPNQFETVAKDDVLKKLGLPLYVPVNNNDISYLQRGKMSYRELADSLKYNPELGYLKLYTTGIKTGYLFYSDRQDKIKILYYKGDQYALTTALPLFKAQHSFKLDNLVFSQSSPSEVAIFEQGKAREIIPVTGLSSLYSPVFKEDAPVLFSNETGTFFYAAGKLYQYELRRSSIVATLVFENLPCTGVVNVMKERTTGDFFISTESEGIYRIKKKQFSVINVVDTTKTTPGANTRIRNNVVYSLHFWDAKQLFTSGYIVPVARTGAAGYLSPVSSSGLNPFFLHKKDSSHLWINHAGGIYNFNTETATDTLLTTIFNPRKAVDLADGSTLILTANQIIAVQNGRATELYRDDSLNFTTMEKVSEDCFLLGSSTGLHYFYPAQKKLRTVTYKQALQVRFLFKDRTNELWFTTYGQGLFHVSGTTITALPPDNAGYLAIAHSMMEDNSGNVWITTNHGLFKVTYASMLSIVRSKSSKLYYTYFDKTDGFNSNEFNGGCYPSGLYQPETGKMFFPSMNGIVTFNPDSIKSVRSNSPVFFDEVILNDTGHVYNVTNDAVFPRLASSIRFYFSSPYYGPAGNIKFSYTLSNAPGQWNDLGSSRDIVLSNLPGGSYTLTLRKEEGAASPVLTTLQFDIQRAFTETIWFKLLLLAGVVGLVYLYFKARLLYLHRERRRLEKEVAARTADQRQLIGQLKENITSLTQLQGEMEQMIGHRENIIAILIHDIKSPLYFLNTVANHLNKSITTNPTETNYEIAREIATSLNRLYLFTQDFAIWLNVSESGQLQKTGKLPIEGIVEESLAVYEEIIVKKGLSIRQEIKTGFVDGDEPMIKSVIRNLVDNAVKYTATGCISISAARPAGSDTCEITIADEGKGLTEAQLAELNHYFQSELEILSFSSSRFGHKIIKDFIRKQNGTIRYRHNSPGGIAVTVTLPAGQEPVME